jgi:hypothetical protein
MISGNGYCVSVRNVLRLARVEYVRVRSSVIQTKERKGPLLGASALVVQYSRTWYVQKGTTVVGAGAEVRTLEILTVSPSWDIPTLLAANRETRRLSLSRVEREL